eukprot:2227519-Rhodomonas_salina.3
MASVAQMTGTMIDSGCKHIIPTRVSMETMLHMSEHKDQNVYLQDKMRYCAHKNDLLLCVNKSAFRSGQGMMTKHAAYPHVLSTFGDAHAILKFAIPLLYSDDDYVLGGKNEADLCTDALYDYQVKCGATTSEFDAAALK